MSRSDASDVKPPTSHTGKPINMNRLRYEAIERRRLKANDIIKLRKRKLSELYYVNKSPFIPISDQKIIETQGNLLEFLEKNDLEKNNKFDIATLPLLGASRSSSSSAPLRNNNAASRQAPLGRNTPGTKRHNSASSISPSIVKKISPPLQQKPKVQTSQQTPRGKPLAAVPQQSQQPQPYQQQEQQQQVPAPSSSAITSSSSACPSQSPPVVHKADEVEEPRLKIPKIEPSEVKVASPAVSKTQNVITTSKEIDDSLNPNTEQERSLQQNMQNPSFSPVVNNNRPVVPEEKEEISQYEEVYQVPPIPNDYVSVPTLSSLIQAYAESRPSDSTEEETLLKKRQLDISEIDINKLSVLLTPGHLPSQIPESSPLAELYYLTQTCPLSKLIPTTHKALTTETYESALLEGKLAVVYSRIEELKRQKKWSLRQPQRYHDPFISHSSHKSHWGNLVDEAKWMAIDFKEGRKFKLVQSMFIAQSITDYWNYGKVMCVKRKPIRHLGDKGDSNDDEVQANKLDSTGSDNMEQKTENLKNEVNNEDQEKEVVKETTYSDDENKDNEDNNEDEIEKIQQEEITEKDTIDVSLLLKRPDPASEIPVPKLPEFTREELPKLTQPFKMYINKDDLSALNRNIIDALPTYEAFSDTHETKELPIIPVSKLLLPIEEDNDDWYKVTLKENYFFRGSSYATEKGLFGFSSTKRLTFIRPPMPPPLKYLDLRIPTIWLPEDDRHLIRYVAEFQFNWNIISSHLSGKATRGYFSNIERRTPWQCFERYIQLNDKFQFSDMRGGYTPQAQIWLEAAHKAQTTTKRRISPLGVGNESIQRGHKRLRWASMFEAIRKSMKKRENVPKTNNSTLKKDDKKISAPTPLDLAKLKYERDKAIQEAYLHQNTNLNLKRSTSQQQVPARTPSRANSSNAQVLLVQRQLAAAAVVAANNKLETANNSPELIVQQQLLQIQLQLRRLQKQNSAGAIGNAVGTGLPNARQASPSNDAANAVLARNNSTPNAQKNQLHASNAALQAQQLRLQQLQLQKAGVRSNSNPVSTVTGPNGQPYTNEQLQQLMQLQRQRNLQLQQLQSAPASRVTSNNGTPVMAGANLSSNTVNDGSKVISPGNSSPSLAKSTGKSFPTSFSNSQVTAIVQQIQTQHPHLNKQQVSRLAASYLHNLSTQQQQQQHRAMTNQTSKVIKSTASNPGTPILQPSAQLQGAQVTPQPGRNLASSLQMLNSAQLTKLANSPTLTANQRQQILTVQQQRLRNAGQTVLANNRVNSNNNIRTPTVNRTANTVNTATTGNNNNNNNSTSTPIPTPQQLASQRAKLQEQQLKQSQQSDGDVDTPGV